MARITLDLDHREHAPSWLVRAALAVGRRQYGQDLDTVLAMSHNLGVLYPWALMETAGLRRRSRLPDGLADLVVLVTAAHLGCCPPPIWRGANLPDGPLTRVRR